MGAILFIVFQEYLTEIANNRSWFPVLVSIEVSSQKLFGQNFLVSRKFFGASFTCRFSVK